MPAAKGVHLLQIPRHTDGGVVIFGAGDVFENSGQQSSGLADHNVQLFIRSVHMCILKDRSSAQCFLHRPVQWDSKECILNIMASACWQARAILSGSLSRPEYSVG